MHLMVMAKAPVAGRVKTRLCPPLTPAQAASVAEVSLAATLEAVAACGADEKIVALDGAPGSWLPPGFTVVAQRGATFAERLAAAWADAGGPGLQIGMDTPQVTPSLLDTALGRLDAVSAVLGPALDGGWWAIGMRTGWHRDVFTGVPMSTAETGARQHDRLVASGHTVGLLPALRDIDTIDDAREVAASVPAVARVLAESL